MTLTGALSRLSTYLTFRLRSQVPQPLLLLLTNRLTHEFFRICTITTIDLIVPIENNNMIFFRSIAIWLIFIMIESLNGTIRTLWLVPLLGDLRAHQISFAIGSLLILTIATIFVRWLNISNVTQSIGVGVLWMLLTVLFEVSLGRLAFGYSWAQIAADYDLRQGRLMLLGLLLLLFAPLIATKIRDVSIDRRRRA